MGCGAGHVALSVLERPPTRIVAEIPWDEFTQEILIVVQIQVVAGEQFVIAVVDTG